MTRIVTEREARLLDPAFFRKDRGSHAWLMLEDGTGFVSVNYGGIRMLYVMNDDNTVDHDRGVAWEPSEGTVNVTLWFTRIELIGDTLFKRAFIGVIFQKRPFALNADGTTPTEPITFAQPVMAFRTKFLGESSEESVMRESLEEAGVTNVLFIEFYGNHWPNPTVFRSATQVWALEVDPDSVTGDGDPTEFIEGFEFIPIEELDRRIALEEFEGVNYRAAIALSTWAIWKALHPREVVESYLAYDALQALAEVEASN